MKALLITKGGINKQTEIDAEGGAVVQVNMFGAAARVFVYRRFENKMPVFEEVTIECTHEFDT